MDLELIMAATLGSSLFGLLILFVWLMVNGKDKPNEEDDK